MPRPKVHNTRSIYAAYVHKLLRENGEWWSKYSKPQRAHIVYRKTGGRVEEVISYARFKAVLITYLDLAQEKIISGQCLRMKKLGTMHAARVERNFRRKMVNFHETKKQPVDPVSGKRTRIIYYTTPDWCRIRWNRPYKTLEWVEAYQFSPCDSMQGKGGFKDRFRTAIADNRPLQLSYPFIPFIR